MLKIQFDHQAFSMQRFGGISRYFANIQKHIDEDSLFNYDRGLLFTNNYYLKDQKMPVPDWLWRNLIKKDRKVFKYNRKYSKYCVKNRTYDVFHPTYYNPYFLNIVKKPFVLTVHDFIHELFPEYFPLNDSTVSYKRRLIEKAAHIIAISESTRNDLQKIYHVPDQRVSTIYHGHEAFTGVETEYGTTRNTIEYNYVLYVGDRAAYKNFFNWLTAISPLLIKYDIRVICAGGGAFSSTETEFINRLCIQQNITQVQASEQKLANLYANAIFFAYPSLYEGFGFPILEAFSNNCKVVASSTSCFKEVGGDAALYFDPYSIDSMQEVMEKVLLTSNGYVENIIKGQSQLKKFSMERCMQQTLHVYQSVVSPGRGR